MEGGGSAALGAVVSLTIWGYTRDSVSEIALVCVLLALVSESLDVCATFGNE